MILFFFLISCGSGLSYDGVFLIVEEDRKHFIK